MADVEIRWDVTGLLRWIRETDTPENPAAVEIRRVTELGAHEAREHAPVASKGVYTKGKRFYTPPGYLRDHIIVADRNRDDFGNIAGFWGTRISRHSGAYPYPYAFIANPHGFTRDRGGQTIRSAVNYVIQEAALRVPFTVERAWLSCRRSEKPG